MRLSVVIPAHNEEGAIGGTVAALVTRLNAEKIPHEIVVVNDNSSDGTEPLLRKLCDTMPTLRYVNNEPPNGFGFAVRKGLEIFEGDAVAVYKVHRLDHRLLPNTRSSRHPLFSTQRNIALYKQFCASGGCLAYRFYAGAQTPLPQEEWLKCE